MAATDADRTQRAQKVLAHIDALVASGMTLVDITELAGLNTNIVHKWRNGVSAPRAASASRILSVTPGVTHGVPLLTHEVLLDEWEHMHSLLGQEGAIRRLADAYCESVDTLRKRAIQCGLIHEERQDQ